VRSVIAIAVATGALVTQPSPIRVAATIDVGGAPTGLAFGAGSIWVANYGGGRLERIDPARDKVVRRIPLHGSPYEVAYGAGGVWTSSFDTPTVTRVNPRTGRVAAKIDVGSDAQAGILATRDAVWVAVYGAGLVVHIDPRTNNVVGRVDVGGNPEDVVSWRGGLWVPNENGTLARIDPKTGDVTAKVRVGADPDNAVVCRDRLWTSSLHGPSLVGFACGRALWTARYYDRTVLRIDPETRRITGRVRVGDGPRSLIIAVGNVWVANQSAGTITRLRGV
jgi:streptogramin lyase